MRPLIPEGLRDAPRFVYDGLSSRQGHVYDLPRIPFKFLGISGGKSTLTGKHVYDDDSGVWLWSYANLNPTRYTDPDVLQQVPRPAGRGRR